MALVGGDPYDGGRAVAPRARGEPRSRLLPAFALLATAAIAAFVARATPSPEWLGFCGLALLPLGAWVVAGPARAATVAASLGYVAILVWAYTSRMSPVYAYAGLIDSSPPASEMLAVTALATLPAMWIPIEARRSSTVVLWVLYLMGYLPALVIPPFLQVDLADALPLDLALLASMAIVSVMARLPVSAIRRRTLSPSAFTRLLVALALLASVYIVASFGIHSLPSLQDVYGTRSEFKLALGGVVGGGYVIHWANGVINPMLLAWGLARRRPALVLLAVVGQLLIYSVTGYKATLFSIVFVPLVYAAIALARRSFGLLLSVAVPLVLLLSTSGGTAITGLASRLYATPAQLTWYYYDYYSIHPKYELSHSFLSWLTSSPYLDDPAVNIGSAYFPGTGTNANAGIWADAFANFGFAGIVTFTLVLGVVLWVADALAAGRDARVVGPVLAVATLAVNSGALFTAILTEGVALSFILILVMPPASAYATEASAVGRARRPWGGGVRPHAGEPVTRAAR